MITSNTNPKLKHLKKLMKSSSHRKNTNTFVVEGTREITRALDSGYNIHSLYYCSPQLSLSSKSQKIISQVAPNHIFEVSPECISSVLIRDSGEQVVAIFESRKYDFSDIKKNKDLNELLLIVDGIEKPGNLGAIIRSAVASNIDAMILTNTKCDVYSPATIRNSLGGVFCLPIINSSHESAYDYCTSNQIQIILSAIDSKAQIYCNVNWERPSALIVGSEAWGADEYWFKNSDEKVFIPMNPTMDSLNISVSASIILYEATRQRSKW